MIINNDLRLQINLHPSDVSHSFRLYRAAITPEIYELGIALGVVSLLVGGLITLGVGGSLLSSPHTLLVKDLLQYPIVFIPVFLITGILSIFDLIPSIRIWLKFRKNDDYNSRTYSAYFSNEHIIFQNQGVEVNYKWDFFKDCVEGEKEFILVYGKMLYITIPKRFFHDESEIDIFRMLLKRKLANFKQKNKIWFDFQK